MKIINRFASKLRGASNRQSDMATLIKMVGDLNDRLESLETRLGGYGIGGRVVHIEQDVRAILRKMTIHAEKLPFPQRFTSQRFRGLSQNEEDGITLAIFEHVGVSQRKFVEIGCGSNGGNSGFLALECGWRGLMMDGDGDKVLEAQDRYKGLDVIVKQSWITRENINALIQEGGLSGEIDLLSIDIDGNDYWIWKAITICSPRVVVIEYNSVFGPKAAVTIPYKEDFSKKEAPDGYFGVSLAALNRLAKQKGYRLVAIEPRGVNAYFLRNDVAPDVPECDAEKSFRSLMKISRRRFAEGLNNQDVVRFFAEKGNPLVEVDDLAVNGSGAGR